ncbi:hypothetical protein ACWDSJ_16660 [Nocardia sp. NPDC003482]
MHRTVFAALVVGAALFAASCDYVGGQNSATNADDHPAFVTTTSASVATTPVRAPSASSPKQIRHVSCEDLLGKLDGIRAQSGQPGVDKAVADTIADYPNKPDWAVLTGEQRQAAIDGAHDAATGTCP